MKRSDITPGQVVSKVSWRGSRQGWPILIVSTESYRQDRHMGTVTPAPGARLVEGKLRHDSVGLLAVHLAFAMHSTGDEYPGMDVTDFRAKVWKVRELATVEHVRAAIEASTFKAWDDRQHLQILDDDGTLLGTCELLTGLLMVTGDYIELTLAEQRAAAQRDRLASEAEQQRVANVATYRSLADRMDKLGLTGYHCADWESPTRFERVSFGDMERLLDLAESAVRANRNAGIRD